jgi:hypothetical protein
MERLVPHIVIRRISTLIRPHRGRNAGDRRGITVTASGPGAQAALYVTVGPLPHTEPGEQKNVSAKPNKLRRRLHQEHT